MKINCISCGREINLDHGVFKDYGGSVKCFFCSSMMEVKTTEAVIEAVNLMRVLPDNLTDAAVERNI
jgi:hypothetical protein